jgi:two-component system phosphate regulon sensor histidine kinase PhoR
MRRRLFWQIFPAYVLLTAGLLLILLLEGKSKLREFYQDQAAAGLVAGARLFGEAAQGAMETGDRAGLDVLAKQYGKAAGLRITVVAPNGDVLAESEEAPAVMESHRTRPEIANAIDTRKPAWDLRRSSTLHKDFLYVALPIAGEGKPIAAVIRVSAPATALNDVLQAFERRALFGIATAVFFVVAISWLIARRISRPLEVMTDGAERFGLGQLAYRLPVGGSREIAALAETMNSMAALLRNQIQEGIRQRNEQEAVLLSMQEGVLTVDNRGAILTLNHAGGQMFQLDPAKVRGRPIHEVMRKAAIIAFVEKALDSAEPIEEDMVVYDKEKRVFTVAGNALRNARDERIGVLVVFRDVTQLRHLENVRRDFVANASHELRTPVTSIKGFVETLLDGGLDDHASAVRFLRIVLRQANRLTAIINDILSLAKLEKESSEQAVALQRSPICEVLDAAVEACRHQAEAKSIEIAVNCQSDLSAKINPGLLEQAVINLIDNAVKYSPANTRIDVLGERVPGETLIRVVDRGCGIESTHLPRLFERFYRTDASRSRELGGTGLGLAIVKHIVMTHNGSVSVKSKVGEGSAFTIHLPDEADEEGDENEENGLETETP